MKSKSALKSVFRPIRKSDSRIYRKNPFQNSTVLLVSPFSDSCFSFHRVFRCFSLVSDHTRLSLAQSPGTSGLRGVPLRRSHASQGQVQPRQNVHASGWLELQAVARFTSQSLQTEQAVPQVQEVGVREALRLWRQG